MKTKLCIALAAAAALFAGGCAGNDNPPALTAETETSLSSEVNILGNGSIKFDFVVSDIDGSQTGFEIHTDKTTVGDALAELGLIEGEKSEYGLYVKTVNGITLDYDNDGAYWAFYTGDDYALSGVDSTAAEDGEKYSFKAEKQ